LFSKILFPKKKIQANIKIYFKYKKYSLVDLFLKKDLFIRIIAKIKIHV
jgi:hypothetical protein